MRLRTSKNGKNGKNIKHTKKNATFNYKMLKTSWKVQAKVFFENSTLHGVRYIAENGRPFTEKFMWFICVVVCAIATVVIIISLWGKFQTNPTITGLDTDFHNWKVPFPALTLCQQKPTNEAVLADYVNGSKYMEFSTQSIDDVVSFLLKLSQLSFLTLTEFMNKYNNSDMLKFFDDGVNIREEIYKLMNKCEDIFFNCLWKSSNYSCCSGFFPVFTEAGFCYTFNSRHYESKTPGNDTPLPNFELKDIKETDSKWALEFSVKERIPMPIYILSSDEVAGIDVAPQHVWDFKVKKISFSVKQTYTTDDTRQLSIKQRHCVFKDERKLKLDNIYTYTACTRFCRMDKAQKKCGCIPFFYPEIEGFRHCNLKQLGCINDIIQQIINVDDCFCYLGCDNTVYEVEKLEEITGEGGQEKLTAEFVSWPMLRYKREVLFGWVDLLVSFGGIAGLFLGFSLLSGVEILYYFTVRAFCMAVRDRKELRRIQIEEENKPPDYDLSLVPYFISDPLPGNGINEIINSKYKDYYAEPINVKGKILPKDDIPPFGIEFLN